MNNESASKHVSGEAVFIDDILVNELLLAARVVYSPHAHAKIISFDLNDAKKVPGVHAVSVIGTFGGRTRWGRS